jgi:hypothetical protein
MSDDYGPAPKKEYVLKVSFSADVLRRVGYCIYVGFRRLQWAVKEFFGRKL